MEGTIKKINGVFPVTTTKAVYIDGTDKTLQEAIDNGELGDSIDLSSVSSSEKKVYIFPLAGNYLTIDTVNKSLTIPRGCRIQYATNGNVITDYTTTFSIDFSEYTGVLCLWWDKTDLKFVLAEPDRSHDIYLATSFDVANPDILSLNKDAFIVIDGSSDEVGEMTIFGDSLTAYGVWDTECLKCLRQTATVTNLGIGGSTMATADDQHNPMWARVSEIPLTTNVLVIMAGTNDVYRSVEIGEEGSLDVTTFIGAYEYVLQWALTNIPYVKIVMMTLPRRFNDDGEEPFDTEGFKQATIQLATSYGIPCINTHDELGINSLNRSYTLSDSTVHFGAKTKRRLGAMLADTLRKML